MQDRSSDRRFVEWRPAFRIRPIATLGTPLSPSATRVLGAALQASDTALRLFGKPRVEGHRRVGVTLARAGSVDAARAVARDATAAITIDWTRADGVPAAGGRIEGASP